MYKARFVSGAGRVFRFGYEYGTLFDISDLSGVGADVSMSQGFNQTGETVEGVSVGSLTRQITGSILSALSANKAAMMQAFAPGASGKLYFNDRYYADCVVKESPAFGEGQKAREFALTLLFPFPYWLGESGRSYILGGYTPAFRFPVNYAQPHRFGIKNPIAFVNCYNGGVVAVDFAVEFTAEAPVENYGIINAVTLEYLKINDSLNIGDKTTVYRKNGRLYVEKNGEDIFSKLDEDSTLFTVVAGDNMLKATADSGADNLIVAVSFADAFSGVYDGM